MEESNTLDLRKWKSRDALKHAFWQLLEEVGYSKINVRNITEASGLNRKTFYRNYFDMTELMKEAFQDLFHEVSQPYFLFSDQNKIVPDLFDQCTRNYIRLIQKERRRLSLIFTNHLEGFAQEVWKHMYTLSAPDYVMPGSDPAAFLSDPCSLDLYSNYSAFGTWAHLEWVIRYADLPAEELLSRTMVVYSTHLYNYYVAYRIGERFQTPEQSK